MHKKYFTAIAGSSEELDKIVTARLEQGWKLKGGVAVAVTIWDHPNNGMQWDYIFAQALYAETT